MAATQRWHWPEYAIEAAGLATFMVSAVVFSWLLFHPSSPLAGHLPHGTALRFLMGLAMAATAASIIHSPLGRRSGAHLNPAVTLTYYRLGKIRGADAIGYVVAQFAGGVIGVSVARLALGSMVAGPPVSHAVTLPGLDGAGLAFAGETAISFATMFAVLFASNHARLASLTGVIAATLVCLWITFEAPLSGMSMNPARTLGSALVEGRFDALWIYFVAPPLGMTLASLVYVRALGPESVLCAKLVHRGARSCIFLCRFAESALRGARREPSRGDAAPLAASTKA